MITLKGKSSLLYFSDSTLIITQGVSIAEKLVAVKPILQSAATGATLARLYYASLRAAEGIRFV